MSSTFVGRLGLPSRTCPKCRNLVDENSRICHYCHVYLGSY